MDQQSEAEEEPRDKDADEEQPPSDDNRNLRAWRGDLPVQHPAHEFEIRDGVCSFRCLCQEGAAWQQCHMGSDSDEEEDQNRDLRVEHPVCKFKIRGGVCYFRCLSQGGAAWQQFHIDSDSDPLSIVNIVSNDPDLLGDDVPRAGGTTV